MSFVDLAKNVETCADSPEGWIKVRDEIFKRHEKANTVDEYITLLSLYKMLMDYVEEQLPNGLTIEEVKALKSQYYKSLLKREYVIGESVCIDTLHELTQRELEAGRMSPEDGLIDLAANAVTKPHYSRKQLLRQREKINKIENDSKILKSCVKIFHKFSSKYLI